MSRTYVDAFCPDATKPHTPTNDCCHPAFRLDRLSGGFPQRSMPTPLYRVNVAPAPICGIVVGFFGAAAAGCAAPAWYPSDMPCGAALGVRLG